MNSTKRFNNFLILNSFHLISLILNFYILVFLSRNMDLQMFTVYTASMSAINYIVSIGFLINIYLLKKFNGINKKIFLTQLQSFVILFIPLFFILVFFFTKILGDYLIFSNLYILYLIFSISFLFYLIEILRSYILKYDRITYLGIFLISLPIIRLIFIYILWNTFFSVWSLLISYLISDFILIILFNIFYFKKFFLFKFYNFKKILLNNFQKRLNLLLFFFIYPLILYLDIFVVYFIFPNSEIFKFYIATSFLIKSFLVLFNPLFQIIFKSISDNNLKISFFYQIMIFFILSLFFSIFLNVFSESLFCSGLISVNHCNVELYNKLVFVIPFLVLLKANIFFRLNYIKKISIYEILNYFFLIIFFFCVIFFFRNITINYFIFLYIFIIFISIISINQNIKNKNS
jgi:hypothetical protein